jgi:hypothetical protein
MLSSRSNILISPPAKLKATDPRYIALRCEALSLPGMAFTTDSEHRRYGVGPIDKVACQPMFDPVSMSFLVDRDGATHHFFNEWMMLIGNFDSTLNKAYEASYQQDYVSDVYIGVFDERLNQVMEYRLLNAFPQSIAEVGMNWGSTEPIRLNVTFNYREYRMRTKETNYNKLQSVLTTEGKKLGQSLRIPTDVMNALDLIF